MWQRREGDLLLNWALCSWFEVQTKQTWDIASKLCLSDVMDLGVGMGLQRTSMVFADGIKVRWIMSSSSSSSSYHTLFSYFYEWLDLSIFRFIYKIRNLGIYLNMLVFRIQRKPSFMFWNLKNMFRNSRDMLIQLLMGKYVWNIQTLKKWL